MPIKSSRERADEARQEKLDNIAKQQADGSLTIRTMTDEEREKYPPRPVDDSKPRGRRFR
jgi:hypothetical protein